MHNPYQGEVPFPAFGDGIVLRFKTGDLARLRGKYGPRLGEAPKFDEKGNRVDTFWQVIFAGINDIDPVVIPDLLKAGLKKPGGKDALDGIDFDDLTVPLIECCAPLIDALMLARWGKTAAEFAAEQEGSADDGNPQSGSETASTSSTDSSEPAGATASRRRSAGS